MHDFIHTQIHTNLGKVFRTPTFHSITASAPSAHHCLPCTHTHTLTYVHTYDGDRVQTEHEIWSPIYFANKFFSRVRDQKH